MDFEHLMLTRWREYLKALNSSDFESLLGKNNNLRISLLEPTFSGFMTWWANKRLGVEGDHEE